MVDLKEFGMDECKFCPSHWVRIEEHSCPGRMEAMLNALKTIAAGTVEAQLIARECLNALNIK